jgi:hypothetical protein
MELSADLANDSDFFSVLWLCGRCPFINQRISQLTSSSSRVWEEPDSAKIAGMGNCLS